MEFLAYYILICLCFWFKHWEKAKKEAKTKEELESWGDDWTMCLIFWPAIPLGYIIEWFEKKKNKEDK